MIAPVHRSTCELNLARVIAPLHLRSFPSDCYRSHLPVIAPARPQSLPSTCDRGAEEGAGEERQLPRPDPDRQAQAARGKCLDGEDQLGGDGAAIAGAGAPGAGPRSPPRQGRRGRRAKTAKTSLAKAAQLAEAAESKLYAAARRAEGVEAALASTSRGESLEMLRYVDSESVLDICASGCKEAGLGTTIRESDTQENRGPC